MEKALIGADEVPDTGTARADLFGRPVLVTKVHGRNRAYVDSCPHFGGPLERDGDKLVCGWHAAEFALDGRCTRGPARAESRVMVLPVREVDGQVTYVYTAPEGTPGAHEDDTDAASRLADPEG